MEPSITNAIGSISVFVMQGVHYAKHDGLNREMILSIPHRSNKSRKLRKSKGRTRLRRR